MADRGWIGEFEVEDIVVEILARLPVKALMRFRCVCKSWSALISHPYFDKKCIGITNKRFHLMFVTRPLGLIEYDATSGLEFPLSILDSRVVTTFFGSCNGLVCLQLELQSSMYIWNPSTRDHMKLPKPKGNILDRCMELFYGFGYDSITNDYKVILGFSCPYIKTIVVHVFALKSGSWRILELGCDYGIQFVGVGCLLNGALHWLGSISQDSTIVSFDIEMEELVAGTIVIPSMISHAGGFLNLTVLNNSLMYLYVYHASTSKDLKVWMMKEYGVKESWTQVLEICGEVDTEMFSPLCILHGGEFLLLRGDRRHEIGNEYSSFEFVLYDAEEKRCKNVVEMEKDIFESYCFSGVYTETLVSPKIRKN